MNYGLCTYYRLWKFFRLAGFFFCLVNLRSFESTSARIFLCFPDHIFRNGLSCVKARVLNSWIRSGGDISEYPRKLRSSSTALRSLGQGGSLGACENIYARYVAVFFSSSRRPSVPNHVW